MNIGFAFGEHIKTEKIKRRGYSSSSFLKVRSFLLLLFLLFAVGLCIWKLAYLQLFRGAYYRALSDSNRIRTRVIYSPRGIIFDRNGVPLVFNIPGFRRIISDDKGKSRSIILNKEQALPFLAKGEENIAVDSLREYPYKDVMPHILGYVGQITEDDLKKKEFRNYSADAIVGKTGVEEEYEYLLKGRDGKQLVEVDALGGKVRSLGQTDPVAGKDITLTLDVRLQEAVFSAAETIKKGAIIVSKPTGEILAMVSKPSYDPNLFTLDATYEVSSSSAYKNISSVLKDGQNQPLLNRAIGGVYPPGSTFKLVVAAAGLENKIIDENYHVVDTGILEVGEFSFTNWFYTEYGKTEPGVVDVVRGLSRSNDIFFYKLAELISVDKISAEAEKFGLGSVSGIDLPGEASGTLPTREWKKENIGESWYLGDTYHFGIGQGYLLTTPLQVNMWTAAIANDGVLSKPRLIKNEKLKTRNEKLLSEKTISLIRQGMIESCSQGGVAWPLFEFRIENEELRVDEKNFLTVRESSNSAALEDYREIVIACKTGTAQHGGEKTLPHAWITLFAPAYEPEIIVTVLSESSGEGSSMAAPIAKRVLEAYFGIKQ